MNVDHSATTDAVAEDAAATPIRVDVFLCHNSRDKPLVRQVAEGLELEFGIPHFLDVYAIPTGEAFLPWIEHALDKSTGCAIFLGASGWGPTHLWEAERALERYRRDPSFRLIPVALPGIRDDDMRKLGSGSLFSEVNWADFRNGPVDPDAIAKLRAALVGRPPDSSTAPSRLTPYLVRRDALRWEQSKRRDKSILYRGRQLSEAEALRLAQPDLMSGESIVAFLAASATAQVRRFRIVAALAVAAAVVIGTLAVVTENARRLALARFVASEARQAAGADAGLLLAVEATRIAPTAEAYGALLEKLDAQPFLRHILRVASEPRATAFDPSGSALYVGQADGRIARIDLRTLSQVVVPGSSGAPARALEVDPETGEVWAGLENGKLVIYDASGSAHEVERKDVPPVVAADGTISRPVRRLPILALQIDPKRRWVAAGDHDHRLSVFDRNQRTLAWTRLVSAQRVTSVSFSSDGSLLAAASSEGLVEVFDSASGRPVKTHTTARTGNPFSIAFARNGDLRAIDDGPVITVFPHTPGEPNTRSLEGSGLTSAAVGPRREYGPATRRDHFILGFGSGNVSLTPVNDAARAVTIPAHARTVYATALTADGNFAASGAGDGAIAIWDLTQRSALVVPRHSVGGQVLALGYDDAHRLTALTSSHQTATLARLSATGWETVSDLAAASRRAAGDSAVDEVPAQPDARGFVPVPESVVDHAAFTESVHRVAWSTRNGAVLWAPTTAADTATALRGTGPRVAALAVSRLGRYVYIAEEDGAVVRLNAEGPSNEPRRHRPSSKVRQIAAAWEDSSVFISLEDGTIRRVDFERSPPAEAIQASLNEIAGEMARLSENDTILVGGAGSSAGVDVALIEVRAAKRLHTRRLGGAAHTLALSKRANMIVVGDFDGRLHLWDLPSLTPMATINIANTSLDKLAFSRDGMVLAIAADASGEVYELSMNREEWRRKACDIVRRDLSAEEWNALVPNTARPSGCKRESER